MRRFRRQRRIVAIAFAAVLACGSSAFALDPTLEISQYAHTSWKIRDGFIDSQIRVIAQTPDGFLWLGTDLGLFRFDGVRTVAIRLPDDQPLPSKTVMALLGASDGTLWIGTDKGLVSWNGRTLTNYPDLAGQFVYAFHADRDGSIWVGTMSSTSGKLCTIRLGVVQCHGQEGAWGKGVLGLYEDMSGRLWAQGEQGLWRVKPQGPQFVPLPGDLFGISNLAEDSDGALLVGTRRAVRRLVDGKTSPYRLPRSVPPLRGTKLLRDRDGSLWIGTLTTGLVHMSQGRADVFSSSDGLSGDSVTALFEDAERNIWIATRNGLDRFREFAVHTFTAKQGLSSASVTSVLATSDHGVIVSTDDGVRRWNGETFTKDAATAPRQVGSVPHSLFQDGGGRVWGIGLRSFGYLENDRFVSTDGVPGGVARAIARDARGDFWIANQDVGLLRVRESAVVQQIPWAQLGHMDPAASLAVDPVEGGLWLGFFEGGLVYFKDGSVRASYGTANGLGRGRVTDLRVDRDGTLWAATEGGLSRFKGRFASLSGRNGLPCETVHWLARDDSQSLWLNTICGLVRIPRDELDAWTAAVDHNTDEGRVIRATVFDASDGVANVAYTSGLTPQVAKSKDGRLWFAGADGVSVVDPNHLPFNRRPPPVHIEDVTADHKTYDAAVIAREHTTLPALTRDLQIDYTALSLVAPEKIRFRYHLEGYDREWQDVGNRRQAFYSNLPPRSYRFRVMASNNSGVWNETGAALDFSIAPAYYQTTWFAVASAATILLLLAVLYRIRVMYLAHRFTVRMEERVNERTRIARDLHDTMLQSFQGVVLKFGALSYQLVDRPDVKRKLETIVDEAGLAMAEGRNAVQALRSSTVVTNDLAQAITVLADDLARNQRDHANGAASTLAVRVEGASRDLVPLVRDDVYRIAGEALRNAVRHAGATRIEVEIRYDPSQLRLRVRDDGKGIDPVVLAEGRRQGHYGLAGMRERAQLVGGTLMLWSDVGGGTEIELTVPAARAYAKSAAGAPTSEGQTT